jgi:PAS domain S-box-containing protein
MESSHNLNLLKNVVQTAPLPIAVYIGEELRITLANDAIIKIWDKGNEVIGKCYTDILPELSSQKIFDQAREVFRTGKPFHAFNERVDIVVGGVLKKHYFNYSFTPVTDDGGNIIGIMNTGADVTDLNTARLEKFEAQHRLALALESADLGTYETNLTTNSVVTSERFDKIWGIKRASKREDIAALIHPDDMSIRENAHAYALANNGNLFYEARVVHNDQSIHWVRVKGKIIFDAQQQPLSLIGIVQDITEQKLFSESLEQQVMKKTEELQRSNDDLLQFAHIVSHDLKEPVRKIQIFNSLLKSEPKKTVEEGIAFINKVDLAVNRMTLLIDGILNYSTLNANSYQVEEIDLNTTIDNITTDLELIIEEKQAILVKDEFPKIEGVPILIHQLLYNLINNALKFSKADEPPRVIISGQSVELENEKYIEIKVKDNGIGISAANSAKIFDAFQRLHSKNEYEGNGLGLSLCKKIAERHNGVIKVMGEENVGTEFIVTLPLKQRLSSI